MLYIKSQFLIKLKFLRQQGEKQELMYKTDSFLNSHIDMLHEAYQE